MDRDKWTRRLAEGGVVEFEQSTRRRPAHEPEQEVGPEVVTTEGVLTDSQKADVERNIESALVAHTQEYRSQPTGTPAEIVASLGTAMTIALYEAVRDQLRKDEAWVFVGSESEESMRVAWRNVPRGWRSMKMRNVTSTDDGKPVHLIFAVNPDEYPALQSTLEQLQSAHQMQIEAERGK